MVTPTANPHPGSFAQNSGPEKGFCSFTPLCLCGSATLLYDVILEKKQANALRKDIRITSCLQPECNILWVLLEIPPWVVKQFSIFFFCTYIRSQEWLESGGEGLVWPNAHPHIAYNIALCRKTFTEQAAEGFSQVCSTPWDWHCMHIQ